MSEETKKLENPFMSGVNMALIFLGEVIYIGGLDEDKGILYYPMAYFEQPVQDQGGVPKMAYGMAPLMLTRPMIKELKISGAMFCWLEANVINDVRMLNTYVDRVKKKLTIDSGLVAPDANNMPPDMGGNGNAGSNKIIM